LYYLSAKEKAAIRAQYETTASELNNTIMRLTEEKTLIQADLDAQIETYSASGARIEQLTKDLTLSNKKLKEKEKSLKIFMENVEETATYKSLRGINEDLILEVQALKTERDKITVKNKFMSEEIEKMVAYAMNEGLHIPTSVSLADL
jgi:seryl-tRNA synthetase